MLVKRLFATTTGALLSKGAAIITALLLFRQLPAADMGRYTAALTLVSFCAILANAGLNPLTTREIARLGSDAQRWWRAIAPLRLLLALAAYTLLVMVALFVPNLVDARIALVAGLLLVPDALAAMLAATLNGLGRAALASWLDALSNLIGLLATLALVLLWHADIFALAWLVVALAGAAFALNGLALTKSWQLRPTPQAIKIAAKWPRATPVSCRGQAKPAFAGSPPTSMATLSTSHKPTPVEEGGVRAGGLGGGTPLGANLFAGGAGMGGLWRQALIAAVPLGLGALAATLYFRVDTLFLSAARGGRAVAYYSAPYQIVESFWLISTSWNAIALPALARRYSPRFVERSVALLLSIGLPASLLISFRAEDVTRLVFGQNYLPAALPLRWVIWVVPILFGYVPVVTALFVHDRQSRVLLVLLTNLALALLLDALLIPSYGALGASIATVIVEAGALAGYLWLAHRARLGINWARGLYQPALISIPLIGLLVIGHGLPFPLLLACTLLLWAALFGLLRPWATSQQDRASTTTTNASQNPVRAGGLRGPQARRRGFPQRGHGNRLRPAVVSWAISKTTSTARPPEEVNSR
ncbi:MAG TPA: oligosaccharide flippase family protein [Ktedonobacterales bacterium]